MKYWVDQPGIAVNIIDKLLNYTILTPLSVIEWALVDNLADGAILAKSYVYEMIAATMGKVTNRVRQIVVARTQPGLVEPQLSVLDETLTREKGDMQAMFQLIEDSLVSIAAATNGQMMERDNDTAEDEIVREWAKRWLRVFRRKGAVEEAFIADAMIGAVPVGTTVTLPKQATTPSLGPDVIDGGDDLADIE
jgi:nuclear cap-binding protein subunit 1